MPGKNSWNTVFQLPGFRKLNPVICLLFIFCSTRSQVPKERSFPFLDHEMEQNIIQNSIHLDSVFEKLYQQRQRHDRQIRIIHIGDSHIQADYLTRPVRLNLQNTFGNAGRGLIVPYELAGTNGPASVIFRSPHNWESKRCIHPEKPLPIGIGGVTLSTNRPDAQLDIFMNDLWSDYAFNSLIVFQLNNDSSIQFVVKDSAGQVLTAVPENRSATFTSYRWEVPVHAVSLQPNPILPSHNHATIFGIHVATPRDGIIYNSIGVNGARYEHFHKALLFAEQTAVLKPDLIIVSLGTNEALYYPYLDKQFPSQIHNLITAMATHNPEARFILVTPQESFRKRNLQNPGIATVRDSIIRYAVDNGLSFYDQYQVTGGSGSAHVWRKNGLLRNDGIHLTKEGYELLGNLFLEALMKSYNRYVSDRHP